MIPSPVQLCAVLTFGLLAGCTHPVASEQPPAAMRVNPLAETQAGVSAQPLPERWWQLYQDPQLGRWVERALANNQDLAKAEANVRALLAGIGEFAAEDRDLTALDAGQRRRRR